MTRLNIKEGLKRIYIVFSVLIVAFSLFLAVEHKPSKTEWIVGNAVRSLEHSYTYKVANNPRLALPKESASSASNTTADPFAELREKHINSFERTSIFDDYRGIKDINSFKRISALPTKEIVGACETTVFFVPDAYKECRQMASEIEERDRKASMYWVWVVLTPTLTALVLYGVWKLLSWVFSGFSTNKQ